MKEEVKEIIIKILREEVKRDGIEELIKWLEESDFFTAPASTKFHLAVPGGLAQHSLNVFERLAIDGIYNIETVAIVSLLHDICKANYYAVDYRNAKNDKTGQWEKVPYYTVKDKFPYGHGEKSVYIISKFIKLTDEEAMAIRWHMGGFDSSVKGGDYGLSIAFEKYPLSLLLHIADMQASYLDEKGGN